MKWHCWRSCGILALGTAAIELLVISRMWGGVAPAIAFRDAELTAQRRAAACITPCCGVRRRSVQEELQPSHSMQEQLTVGRAMCTMASRRSVYLPVRHGTGAETLERTVGHVVGTSLPVGGAGTHAVLSAHSRMASAKLFQRIYTERQAGLADALACEEPAVLLRDSLELVMPVYLGASDSHLAAGAAVLGNTSVPIGGMSTNCVIAGHRGWYGADYFRHIDRLQVGDMVTITNLWETLTYAVVDMKIIQPDQVDKIKIQPGRDLLTLITCHPYASGGRQRLVVYCERRK